jgi:hypothetical protein
MGIASEEFQRRGAASKLDWSTTGKSLKSKNQAALRVCVTWSMSSDGSDDSSQRSVIAKLSNGHFLGHVQDQLAIPFLHFAQQAAKLVEKAGVFAHAAPRDVIRRLPLGEIWQNGRLLAVIKELIEWALESACQLFQCFDGRYGMAILDAGNITAKQAGTFFDVALGEFLFFAECAKSVTDNHGGIIPCR